MRPKVVSLFSGIGGFDLGLERAGFEVVAQCDNDRFCNRVLAKHWPGVTRIGDVRAFSAGYSGGAPDLICGGFPCQDLSVAGKRAGLYGGRSGLWFDFHHVLSELRPACVLIENVPGLLSSNHGRDFAILLAGLEELWPGRWGWAVLDSRYFGVPQRRRRVYIVAGPPRERIAQVLSLCEGGDWHPQAGTEAGEDIAGTIGGGAYGAGRRPDNLSDNLVVYSLTSNQRNDPTSETYVTHSLGTEGFNASEDGTGRGTPLAVIQDVRKLRKAQNGIGIRESETMYTLDVTSRHAVAMPYAVRRLTPVECLRLQGFPDDWCDVPGASDSAIYRAAGNAVTVPVIEYLGLRLMRYVFGQAGNASSAACGSGPRAGALDTTPTLERST